MTFRADPDNPPVLDPFWDTEFDLKGGGTLLPSGKMADFGDNLFGYVVSAGNDEMVIPEWGLGDGDMYDTSLAVRSLLRDVASVVVERGLGLGWWWDTGRKALIVDTIEIHASKALAVMLGRYRHQKAIFDLSTWTVIDLT